ncbi:MAG: hypothetical protein AAB268_00680 [Elusimicrobiota bacterium]
MKEKNPKEAWRRHAKIHGMQVKLPKGGRPCSEVTEAVAQAMARLPYKQGKHRAVRSAIVFEFVYEDGTVFSVVTENRAVPFPSTVRGAWLEKDGSPVLMGNFSCCLNGKFRRALEGGEPAFFYRPVRFEKRGEYGVRQ